MFKLWKATAGACLLGLTALSCSAGPGGPGPGATGDSRDITSAPPVPAVCATVTSTSATPASETDGSRLDTGRIQDALNQCGSGSAVKLSGGAFLSGPLTLPSGVSLILDQGVVLYASRQAAVYDDPRKAGMAHCGQYDRFGKSCRPLITIANSSGGGIFGPGAIDGQGGLPIIYPSDWGPPALCTSSHMPAGFPHAMSWWDFSNCVDVINTDKLADDKADQSNPVLIRASGRDLNFSGFVMRNAARSHLQVADSANVTVWGITVNTPSDFADYGMARAHNTDGVDLINVSNATVSHATINAGDDHVAIDAKANSTAGPSANITVAHNRFYGGHGISIGSMISGGVRNVLVEDIVIDGGPNASAMNGIHIKSNGGGGGYVENATFRHLCIRNALNAILVETHYAHQSGGGAPIHYSGIDIEDVSIFNETPKTGRIIFDGSAATTPIEASLRDILIDNPAAADASQSGNTSFNLAGKLSFTPKGAGVTLAQNGYQLDASAKPTPACAAELAQPAPFAISRQLKTKSP
jgi:polygalacturonase